MDAVNYSDLRRHLRDYMQRVYEEREPLIVTRKNNENVVLMSIDQYNSLVETDYLLSTDANARHLRASVQAARAGRGKEHDLIDE